MTRSSGAVPASRPSQVVTASNRRRRSRGSRSAPSAEPRPAGEAAIADAPLRIDGAPPATRSTAGRSTGTPSRATSGRSRAISRRWPPSDAATVAGSSCSTSDRRAAMIARYGISPASIRTQTPVATRKPSRRASAPTASARRVRPTPASPPITRTADDPSRARSSTVRAVASSPDRATKGTSRGRPTAARSYGRDTLQNRAEPAPRAAQEGTGRELGAPDLDRDLRVAMTVGGEQQRGPVDGTQPGERRVHGTGALGVEGRHGRVDGRRRAREPVLVASLPSRRGVPG